MMQIAYRRQEELKVCDARLPAIVVAFGGGCFGSGDSLLSTSSHAFSVFHH